MVPKFIDFGLSKIILHGETSEDRFGTIAYCSPEILLGQMHSHQTDIWSLGVVLHVMLSGIFPFISPDKAQTKRNIVTGKLNFSLPQWARVTNDGKDLVSRMLTPKLKKRLTL